MIFFNETNNTCILSLQLIVFSTFGKITVGGFVNQLIKKFWPKCVDILLVNITVD